MGLITELETETLFKKIVKLDLKDFKEVDYGPDFVRFSYNGKKFEVSLREVKSRQVNKGK